MLPAPDNTTTPCLDFGYDIYFDTETHSAGPVAMVVDMYTKEQ